MAHNLLTSLFEDINNNIKKLFFIMKVQRLSFSGKTCRGSVSPFRDLRSVLLADTTSHLFSLLEENSRPSLFSCQKLKQGKTSVHQICHKKTISAQFNLLLVFLEGFSRSDDQFFFFTSKCKNRQCHPPEAPGHSTADRSSQRHKIFLKRSTKYFSGNA